MSQPALLIPTLRVLLRQHPLTLVFTRVRPAERPPQTLVSKRPKLRSVLRAAARQPCKPLAGDLPRVGTGLITLMSPRPSAGLARRAGRRGEKRPLELQSVQNPSSLHRILCLARRYDQRPQTNAFLAFDDGLLFWVARILQVYCTNLARVKNARIRVLWVDKSARETAGVDSSNMSDIVFPLSRTVPLPKRNVWIVGFSYPGFTKLARVCEEECRI